MEQREDLALVALDQPRVGLLVEHRPPELHAVLLAEALDLAVAEHRQPGQRREDRRDAEVLVALAELLDRGLLVRVAHEVDVALEDLRVELERLLDDLPVARPVLVAEHVHERAVVDAVHAERPDEVALEQPERLGQQERVGHLGGDPVDDLAPELDAASGGRTRPSGWRARRATGSPPAVPGSGHHSRWMCFLARTIAASKRMIGNCRATSRIVWMTCSRTAGSRKSSWAVSFHGKLVPSLPW